MIQLSKTLLAWNTPEFTETLKKEIETLDINQLPLQQGLSLSSAVANSGFSVMVISISEQAGLIRVKTGIHYSGIIAGCNCADDPTPIDEQLEYCEIQFDIDKQTGSTAITLLENE